MTNETHISDPLRPTSAAVDTARRSVFVVFAVAGFIFASWVSRIPQIRTHLHLDQAALGWLMFCGAVGSILANPLSGLVIHRLGTKRTIQVTSLIAGLGVATFAIGLDKIAVVGFGLFLFGVGFGAWDIAMNVQGAEVERHSSGSIMARFHAFFSVGTVVGALLGAAAIRAHMTVTTHLLIALCVAVVAVWLGVRGFLPDPHDEASEKPHALSHWKEPRTLLIGFAVLAFAATEGIANDWVSVASIDGYKVRDEYGALAFATFLIAMTITRWIGHGFIDRFGRVAVLRALTAFALAGVLLFVFANSFQLALVGVLLWGIGAALGFPTAMSAASDDPRSAAGRVSVVASIGYCAFLLGPPTIGFIARHTSTLQALLTVAILLAVAFPLIGALKPLQNKSE